MKQLLFSILLFSTLTTKAQKKDTTSLTVKGSVIEWTKHLQKIDLIMRYIDNANLPNQDTKFIIQSLDSVRIFILPQLQKQIADTTK